MDTNLRPFDIEAAAERLKGAPGALLGLLEEIQAADAEKHLSDESLKRAAKALGEAPSRVWSVATFYGFFNLRPQGRHTLTVCRGTACHTRGSLGLLKDAAALLGISGFEAEDEASFTSADREYSIRTVACFGQCALAPVLMLDDEIYSRMSPGALAALLKGRRRRSSGKAPAASRQRAAGAAAGGGL